MESTTEAGRLHGARILIVDDEFLIASALEYLFGDAGATVCLRFTLASALEVACSEAFTAALLDIRLGRDSSERIADVLAARGIPFLFFTGQSLPEAMRAKFPHAPVLSKPVGFGELLSAATGLLPAGGG